MPQNKNQSTIPAMIIKRNWLVALSLMALYLIWGSTYLAIRFAVHELPPFLMSGTRFMLAGGLLLLIMKWRAAKMPTAKQTLHAGIVGVLMLGSGASVVAFAEQYVGSGLAAIMITAVPIWAALFSGLFGRWPVRLEWVGIVVGLVGVILLNLDNGLRSQPLGAIAILFAAGSWAFGSVLAQTKRLDMPPGAAGFGTELFIAGIVITLFGIFFGEKVPTQASWQAIGAWLYLSIFGSLIAFSAYMYLVNTVHIVVATSYAYVNPIIAVLLGISFGNETISALGISGMVVILAGVGIIAYSQTTKKKREKKHVKTGLLNQ